MDLELILPVSVLVAFSLGVLALRRRAEQPLPWWWAAWCALVAALVCRQLDLRIGSAFEIAFIFAPLFAVFTLAGALRLARLRVPGWLLLVAAGVGLARSSLPVLGLAWAPPVLSLAFDMPILATAALVAYRARALDGVLSRRALPAAIGLLLLPRGLDAWNDLTATLPVAPVWLWFAVSAPLAILQIIEAIESGQRATERISSVLAENLRRVQAIAESAYDLLVETDEEGRIRYVTPNFKDVLGLDPASLLDSLALDLVHPEDRDGMPQVAPEANAVRRLAPFRLRAHDGSYRWFEGTVGRYLLSGGEIRVFTVSRDITERVRFEERMRDTHKLESLGLLAGGIAHDFNNLLVPMLTNAGLALEQPLEDAKLARLLRDIEEGAQRAADLTRQLLAYAGRRHRDETSLDLSELTGDVTSLLEPSLKPNVNLVHKLSPDLPPIFGDASQVLQVVTNLVTNAADAIGDRPGTIALRTDTVTVDALDPVRTEHGAELDAGRYVFLEVSDDGCGMEEEVRARIFDPFFTTKNQGRGLGLAVLLGIIRAHAGAVQVSTKSGLGTTVRVLFPASNRVEVPPPASAVERPPPGTGTVLVVDDEEMVRDAAARVLEFAGYDVIQVEDGRSALKLLEQSGTEITAVLMDVTMPQLTGDAAYFAIREIHPTMPVIFSSGFSEEDLVGRLPADPNVAFLEKPYRPGQLIAIFAELLDHETLP